MNHSGSIAAAAAFTTTILLVSAVKALCIRWRLFDPPGPLNIHLRDIPRLGGIAVALAIASSVSIASPHLSFAAGPIFVSMGIVWITGVADDLRSLSPFTRLATQLSAALVLWHAGWRIPATGTGAMSAAAVCVFVVLFINAINFLDGADGLAAGTVCIIAIAYILSGLSDRHSIAWPLAWSVAGVCAGFLFFNFPPAGIYLGDGGSTVLGLCIAFLALDSYQPIVLHWPPQPSRLLLPVLVGGLPLLDALLAVIRRLRAGASPFRGDCRHIYDVLSARGWAPKRVALVIYGTTGALAVAGWAGMKLGEWQFVLAFVLATTALLSAEISLGVLQEQEPAAHGKLPRCK